MQFAFSLASGALWSIIATLEMTALFPEPFTFTPIRSAILASFGVTGIVAATMHYAWQLWYARITSGLSLLLLCASYWADLLPQGVMRTPTILLLVITAMAGAFAGYEKAPESIQRPDILR